MCPQCNKTITTTGKHIHRCYGEYIPFYNGKEIGGYYASASAARTDLDTYVYHLLSHDLIPLHHEQATTVPHKQAA